MADLTATLFFLLAIVQTCNTAQLTINPPSLILSGNSSVGIGRITCTPGITVSPQDLLFNLAISRVATGSTAQSTLLGSASQRYNNNGAARMDTVITGATIEGSLSQQSITITMTQATCTDEATFVCNAAVFSSSQAAYPTSTEDRKNFTADLSAGSVSMTQEPLLSAYRVDDTLIMRCNGLVGSNEPAVKIEWVWQYKDIQGFMWNDYGRAEDISHDNIVPDTIPCQNRQTSTLARQITMDDYRREYRCFVRRNGLPSEPDFMHSATYLIGVVYEEQPPVDAKSTLSPLQVLLNSRYDAGYDSGWTRGAGLGFGVMAAVGVVMVVALLVWTWRRQWKLPCAETEKANENQVPTAALVAQGGTTSLSLAPPLQQGEPSRYNPVRLPGYTGTYCELNHHEVGLRSPYAELNPYTELSYRDATSHRQI